MCILWTTISGRTITIILVMSIEEWTNMRISLLPQNYSIRQSITIPLLKLAFSPIQFPHTTMLLHCLCDQFPFTRCTCGNTHRLNTGWYVLSYPFSISHPSLTWSYSNSFYRWVLSSKFPHYELYLDPSRDSFRFLSLSNLFRVFHSSSWFSSFFPFILCIPEWFPSCFFPIISSLPTSGELSNIHHIQ